MCSGVEDGPSLRLALETASVIALGPGLGQGPWGQSLFEALREVQIPMVVDADALNLLANNPVKKANWILTPHPGEAARLLGVDVEDINVNRIASAKKIQNSFGGVVVLKGAGTVVVDAQGEVGICSNGNPGMASGGMGDVLTGVIAGLLAQGMLPGQAAQLGVCLHARAGDLVASEGQCGLMASDLFPVLRRLLG
jgi:NAD(P)H-hydrate epimerase